MNLHYSIDRSKYDKYLVGKTYQTFLKMSRRMHVETATTDSITRNYKYLQHKNTQYCINNSPYFYSKTPVSIWFM